MLGGTNHRSGRMTPTKLNRRDLFFRVLSLSTGVVLLACATTAYGWGETGHRIVARIADGLLTDQARAKVRSLLRGNTMENVSVFADHYRLFNTNSAPWHFVDIPVRASHYDPKRDCREHQGCVVDQLEQFKKVLLDT